MTEDPPGLRMAALRDWLESHDVPVHGAISATLLAGGRSNISYRVTDEAAGAWVVRRPPLGHVMPSAHDMRREYRGLAGLNRVAFPAPAAIASCEDETVIGAPFMVMAFVPGDVIDSAEEAARLAPQERGTVSASLVHALAALHSVDVQQAGLESLGRPAGYLTRQVDRWGRQWQLSKTRDLATIDELQARLAALVGAAEFGSTTASIVHGDYRVDNVIIGPDDHEVRAVLDWEMATLGDPVADLAVTLVYWNDQDDSRRLRVPVSEHITVQEGFWSRAELIDAYARLTGNALDHLDFCTALACFKLAVIMESIRFRAMSGDQLGTAATDVEGMGQATEALSELGLEVLARGTIEGLSH